MNKDNNFFSELELEPKAKWVIDFLNNWERESESIADNRFYIENSDNMEKLTFAAWKHYFSKEKA